MAWCGSERCGRWWLYCSTKRSMRACSWSNGGGLDGLGAQPLLQGLLEAFDLAAGGGVVGAGVLLEHVPVAQLLLEGVAAAAATGVADGVDHPVVGEGGGRDAVLCCGFAERGDHDRGADPVVSRYLQGVAGVVVEPADDLYLGPGLAVRLGEPVVREVGLPALVGHRGLEPDVGGPGSLLRLGFDQALAGEGPAHCGHRHRDLVVVPEVPGDGVGSGVQTGLGQFLTQPADELHGRGSGRGRRGMRAPRQRFERCLTDVVVAGFEPVHPGAVHPVPRGDLRNGLLLHDKGCDHQARLRHERPSATGCLSPMS